MSEFSNFLTTFNGGINTDGAFNDLMSSAIIVPSLNTSLDHINDGFIYLSNLLIQFSATNLTNHTFASGSSHTFKFPIDTSNNFIPYMVNVCGSTTNTSSSNSLVILSTTWTGTSFTVRASIGSSGNATWFSIGPKPTSPIYTNTSNFSTLSSIAINETGQIQYLCDGLTIKKNSSYGYGGWSTLTTVSSSFNWIQITCSYSGQYVGACRAGTTNNYALSFDYGLNWNYYYDTPYSVQSITCSNNGIFYIFSQTGYVYKRDSSSSSSNLIQKLSSTGNYILTNNTNDCVYLTISNQIYRSNNDSSFNSIYSVPGKNFIRMATNRTGQYLAVCDDSAASGDIYIFSDYGNNFILKFTTNSTLKSITSNGTGKYLSVATSDGIYYSTDYGETWNKTNAPNNTYVCISMNANANIATSITSAGVYVSFNASN
jgi:hypothetical protein